MGNYIVMYTLYNTGTKKGLFLTQKQEKIKEDCIPP